MTNVSRRRFLEESMLAISAAGAASVGMVGAAPRPARAQVGPNEKIGVCVIGIGGRGWGSHCKEWCDDPRTEIRYLCDPDVTRESRCEQIAKRQGGVRPKFVTDMRRAFDDPAVDVVSNASTNHWHALCGVWAMQAKKHCYLEKPICHNVHEGRALGAEVAKGARQSGGGGSGPEVTATGETAAEAASTPGSRCSV